MSETIKIKVTKEHLHLSHKCRGENIATGCVIAEAFKTHFGIDANIGIGCGTANVNGHIIVLPQFVRDYIAVFDTSTPKQRMRMLEIEFEVKKPDNLLNNNNEDTQ